MNRVVYTKQDPATTEWVVRLVSTDEELARFDSAHLARQMVSRINRASTAHPMYVR